MPDMQDTQYPDPQPNVDSGQKRSAGKSLAIGVIALLMVLYLLNPLAGIDFLPDNLPIFGNIDEAAATAILLGCLSYFGIELPWLRRK